MLTCNMGFFGSTVRLTIRSTSSVVVEVRSVVRVAVELGFGSGVC